MLVVKVLPRYNGIMIKEDWTERAACLRADPDLFFHPDGERGLTRKARVEAAKKVCAQCVVIDLCRDKSLENREAFGTWGGLSEDERASILRHGARRKYS